MIVTEQTHSHARHPLQTTTLPIAQSVARPSADALLLQLHAVLLWSVCMLSSLNLQIVKQSLYSLQDSEWALSTMYLATVTGKAFKDGI